jgi:hypothetical protein
MLAKDRVDLERLLPVGDSNGCDCAQLAGVNPPSVE